MSPEQLRYEIGELKKASKPARARRLERLGGILRSKFSESKQLTEDTKSTTGITTFVAYTCAQKRDDYGIKVLPMPPCSLVEESGLTAGS